MSEEAKKRETCPHCGDTSSVSFTLEGQKRFGCGSSRRDRSWRCYKRENKNLSSRLSTLEAENERLRAEVGEWVEEAFIQGARLDSDNGRHPGWYCTQARSSLRADRDWETPP